MGSFVFSLDKVFSVLSYYGRHPSIRTLQGAIFSLSAGWSEPVPGRELHPLESSAFHGALFRQLSRSRLE